MVEIQRSKQEGANDKPVPPIAFQKVYDSPFIQADRDSGVVTLQKGARKLVLNFYA